MSEEIQSQNEKESIFQELKSEFITKEGKEIWEKVQDIGTETLKRTVYTLDKKHAFC